MANRNEDINIIYASIIREKHTILSEYTECSGNFSQIIEHIMKEIINKFQDTPNIFRTFFFYGKYAIFLIKNQKIYILIMFPNTKINNMEIIFSLLYSLFEKLKNQKDFNLDKIAKMRPYTLSNFSQVIKTSIQSFNSNCQSFIPYLKYSKEFVLYEPFENKNLESDVELPVLSNIQVHQEPKINNNEEIYKEDSFISSRKTYNSIYTQDSFKEDILQQEKNYINEDNNLKLIGNENQEDNDKNFLLREKDRNLINIKKLKLIIFILVILLILGGISFLIYYFFS